MHEWTLDCITVSVGYLFPHKDIISHFEIGAKREM